ncbi:metal tolerance protein 11 isoform X1 [Ricinus communis]|uniref:Cation efflux protein/ zinc transporter, putative n=2 Tax=Ricinus communis TaxID=3988 RepID=B9T5Z5_RICCO|nr:metal tolerance protein 11 isoform X1 [Ricinus communis]EEF28723.1 cation efflux protein/ zinc transporter, putative [Ricinus communis]|eukprot:XP_002533664.1 metal tolerance protein 11 [Ricinus communis]
MVHPVAFQNDEELSLLSINNNGDQSWRLNFDGYQLSTEHKEKKQPSSLHDCLGVLRPEDDVAEYYQQQVEMLEGFNEMDALAERGFIPGMSKEEQENLARSETFAIRISNIANMVLFAAKVYASVRSGSLAIIASTLDSLLDLLSGFILWFTAFTMQTPNPYQYPIGKKRMQPLGILVFASVMATLGLQIILESLRALLSDESEFELTKEQERWVVGIMLSVTLVKLLLMVYCRSFTNEIVKAYAQDHFFDVITNIIGLIAALLANYMEDWMDPVGAIILALYTIRTWSMTVLENVNSLVGKSATPDYLKKLTYLCWNHHKAVRHIDTVRAYTFGSHYFVEVDIVLPASMPLQEAHDIGESLQEKLELLPEIERAFVHLDYEYTHKPEHAQSHP